MVRGRTIVFIDNSNVFSGSMSENWRVDYNRLSTYIAQGGDVWQTYFFASVSDPPKYRETGFYKHIRKNLRYEVVLYPLGIKGVHCNTCGSEWNTRVEKGLDVGLATKMLTLAHTRAFDTAILVAADRDYLETVNAVKALGLRVEIYAWRGTISANMEQASSVPVVYFNDLRSDVELLSTPDSDADSLTEQI